MMRRIGCLWTAVWFHEHPFNFEKEVEKNEMDNSCRRSACFPDSVWPVLLYCGWGKGDRLLEELERKGRQDATGKTDRKRFAPDKPQDCRTVIFGISGNVDVQKIACLLLPEVKQDHGGKNGNLGNCSTCPYGKHSPCIGFCLQKILTEMRHACQTE